MTTRAAEVGARIRHARETAGIPQAALAQRLGVTQTAVSYWETGQREPGLASLTVLARVLKIHPLALLDATAEDFGGDYRAGFDAGWAACAKAVQAAAERGAR